MTLSPLCAVPNTAFRLREVEKRGVIWAPGAPIGIEAAPGLYLTNATRPIGDVAPLPEQEQFGLDANYIDIQSDMRDLDPFLKRAFLSEADGQALYDDAVGGVSFKKNGLFSIAFDLPARTPVGPYEVNVFLYRDGVLLARDSASLSVKKVGSGRRIYDIAHQRPLSYGIICVTMSLFAGWLAAVAFRK